MFGLLAKVGGFGLKFLGHTIGTHLFSKELGGLGVGAAQIVIGAWAFAASRVLCWPLDTSLSKHAGFRAGIKTAVGSLF